MYFTSPTLLIFYMDSFEIKYSDQDLVLVDININRNK